MSSKLRKFVNTTSEGDVSYSLATGLGVETDDGMELAPGQVGTKTPLSVQGEISRSQQKPGYIPSPRRKAIMLRRGQIRRAKEQKERYEERTVTRTDIPLITGPPGFRSGATSKLVREEKEERVLEVAKRIRDKRKKAWRKYKRAGVLVLEWEDSDQDKKPTAELREAIAIRKGNPPNSYKKEICMSAARIQVYHREK